MNGDVLISYRCACDQLLLCSSHLLSVFLGMLSPTAVHTHMHHYCQNTAAMFSLAFVPWPLVLPSFVESPLTGCRMLEDVYCFHWQALAAAQSPCYTAYYASIILSGVSHKTAAHSMLLEPNKCKHALQAPLPLQPNPCSDRPQSQGEQE